jgi:2-methylisocitrate lyase-like PEP mutase family enzyme
MAEPNPSIAERRRTFRRLHEAGCFVIPNPWDIGSARLLQGFGFKALATCGRRPESALIWPV